MTQTELQAEISQLGEVINKHGAEITGSLITTTHSVSEDNRGNMIFDSEILIPINILNGVNTKFSDGYQLKKEFQLKNAIMCNFKGRPENLQDVINKMLDYIKKINCSK